MVNNPILNKLSYGSNLINAFGIIGIVGLMVLPVPPALLDVLLTFNITFGLIILLVTIYVKEPLEFSVFPSLLLIVTMFRLALNVASTRLILSSGYAGEVISSFGNFVVRGNYVIGMVIFLIIVVIQFIVITKGAGRIAEVAARFTLDAMPGKQMSIDADLNSGLITEDEARERRSKISREADFYGAMDGSSKFVRGDAIAGIVITLINIIGGLIIGIAQRKLSAGEAAKTYTMLTVGDGLVTQIPALIVSTGAGMIVTRAASKRDFGQDIASQVFNYPRVMLIVSVTLLGLGVVPGLPKLPFIMLGILFMAIFLVMNRRLRKEPDGIEEEIPVEEVDPAEQDELYYVDRLEIEIGYGLIPLVSEDLGGDFLKRVTNIRRQAIIDLGLHISPIRIRDNLQLKQNQYRIKLKGVEIATGTIQIDRHLAIKSGSPDDSIEGITTMEPAFNMPALWIRKEDVDRAEAKGYTVVEPSAVIATHLNEIIHRYADEIMTRQDVKDLVEKVKKYAPAVVEDLFPDQITYAFLQQVLSNLLRERVSIKDMITILETIGYYIPQTRDVDFISERIREALGRSVINSYLDAQGELPVIALHPLVEERFREAVEASEKTNILSINPDFTKKVLASLGEEVERANTMGIQPVVLCSARVRLAFHRFIEPTFPFLMTLAYSELARDIRVKSIGMVKINEPERMQGAGQVA
ncbi:MAG: flagellar biosynthesis protein FlhA [Candidatus Krumholzibacteriota bacterium]|nr:flagellar biosynthesis protein FlhA [Candidatus Krumholzibacteriota bacterium]